MSFRAALKMLTNGLCKLWRSVHINTPVHYSF